MIYIVYLCIWRYYQERETGPIAEHRQLQSIAQAPTINDTFDAKGFTAILALPISTLQNLPLPSQLQGSVFGGIWSFRVVKGNLQDFKLDLKRVSLAGKTGVAAS